MVTITSAELQRGFGRYVRQALVEPVSVTHHGRESVVMLSADEYKRLKALEDRQALYAWELPADAVEALARDDIPEEAARFDHEYR
jgi:prevent-host-death family protein